MENYKKDKSMNSYIGCVKEAKEEKYEMLKNGGNDYGKNASMESKQDADQLAKVPNKK